ncbi:uracil-DNA glycosylase [Helicobacter sp. faydin-H20]|uniref:uracil-DNA glycosylase n=1 Tax=Helicobacter anatolicus TaxID=2905874 RepID=UPI001E3A548F|nr:uracil-DNA glycosylase [Helicobacter anatolicus]MCE3037103.1 uracil-DNA glycosylase [Helicobacter anatolicus]
MIDFKTQITLEWRELLKEEFQKPYFLEIQKHYEDSIKSGKKVFPPKNLLFNALNLTPPQKIKIVILGQDPYHGSIFLKNQEIPQAMGLSFSVPYGFSIPPSLRNIYKELSQNLNFIPPNHGNLSKWAENGILLLNAIFSVEKGKPTSHQHFGWEKFSDAIIKKISQNFEGIVFMLWGNFAKKKVFLIDEKKHCIITAPHPSPLSKGFIGSGVFNKAEVFLKEKGIDFNWNLS